MKLTAANYLEKTKDYNFSETPEHIKEAHKSFSDYAEFYNEDKDIKQMLDNHFKLVENLIKINEPRFPELDEKHPLNILDTDSSQYKKAYEEKFGKPKKVAPKAKKVANKAKKRTSKRKSVAKKPVSKQKAKSVTKSKCNNTAKKVEIYPEDIRLIKRFANTIGKERQRRSILAIYKDLERRKTERKVNAQSQHAELIKEISSKLKKVLDAMTKQALTHVTIEVNEDFVKKIELAVRSLEIRATARLLKSFIGIEGEIKPDKEKVKRIHASFESALKRGKVCNSDLYWKEFNEAKGEMEKYINGSSNKIALAPQQLNGLMEGLGLGKPKAVVSKPKNNGKKKVVKTVKKAVKKTSKTQLSGLGNEPNNEIITRFEVELPKRNVGISGGIPNPTEKLHIEPKKEIVEQVIEKPKNNLFTPITDVKATAEKMHLKGDLGKFLGYVERNEYSIVLRGDKGAGKSRMTYQMMNTFALSGFSCGCFSLEMGKNTNIVEEMKNTYLHPTIAHNIDIAESCPNGIKDVELAAQSYDAVFIDSWGKIPNVKPEDLDMLRKKYPKTMFVFIFQSTTNGTARGGSTSEYDAGIVIQIDTGGIAYCEKNRYSGDNFKYLVFEKRLMTDDEMKEAS